MLSGTRYALAYLLIAIALLLLSDLSLAAKEHENETDVTSNVDRLTSRNSPALPSLGDYSLSNVVLISSVQGGIFGLNRETGSTIWQLSPQASSNNAGLGSMVGTSYGPNRRTFAELAADAPLIDLSEDVDKSADGASGTAALDTLHELGLYIVEPSNGQVYVLTRSQEQIDDQASPKSSLSKLPLTLPQLVDLSPFSFPGDASRVFVGRKSTTLVELDVQTGKVGAIFGKDSSPDVWCANDNGKMVQSDSSSNAQCHKKDGSNWTYMGKTEYTLTIHLRGRPALPQTLHYSTFTPNAADRDMAALWQQQARSTDGRTIMGMPEEGTILCFNASKRAMTAPEQQDRTLWIRELGATVAGIFDIVYPKETANLARQQPLILPHPKSSLQALFSDLPLPFKRAGQEIDSTENSATTYLGLNNGQLYAMNSMQYPLVAFTPKAIAGRESHDENSHKSCSSYGCLLGSYDVYGNAYGDVKAEDLLGLGPGHSPLLGIGDGSDQNAGRNIGNLDQSSNTSSTASSWTSPQMIISQIIVLFLLAVLCGLLYIGGVELRKQSAQEATTLGKELTLVNEEIPTNGAVAENKVAEIVSSDPAPSSIVNNDSDITAVATATAVEDQLNPIAKKSARRRKRGKRAGAVVAQREAKRTNGVEDGEDSGGEDQQSDTEKSKEVIKPLNGIETSIIPEKAPEPTLN